MALEVKLTLTCPRCGSRLILREYRRHVQLYCSKCGLSVTIRKRLILTKHINYDESVLDWASAIDFLYSLLKGKASAG